MVATGTAARIWFTVARKAGSAHHPL